MNASNSPANTAGLSTNPSGQPGRATAPAADTAKIKLKHLGRVLHEPVRWRILRELARGEALPVKELAARSRCTAASASKHMGVLRKAGMVTTGYGRLYKLSAAVQVSPDGRALDMNHCVLKLDEKW